mgnify:FL=1
MSYSITNGLKGVHLATDTPVDIELTPIEMELALFKSVNGEEKWDEMCGLVLERTGIEIIGQIQIDYMVVNGVKHVFH